MRCPYGRCTDPGWESVSVFHIPRGLCRTRKGVVLQTSKGIGTIRSSKNRLWLCGPLTNASVTSNHGPCTIFSTRTIFARKAERSARRNYTPLLFSWSHQAAGPVWFDTAVHLWFDRIIHRTSHRPRAMPVWAPHGNLQRFSYPTGPVRAPQGCRTAPVWTRKGIETTRICKNPTRAYVVVRAVYGLFTISKPVRGT